MNQEICFEGSEKILSKSLSNCDKSFIKLSLFGEIQFATVSSIPSKTNSLF